MKKETELRRRRGSPPLSTPSAPCCSIYPRHPYRPQGAKGEQGSMLNHRAGQLATQHSVGAREAPRARWAKCLATVLGTAGARARSTSEPANGEQPRVFEDRFQRNGVILDQRHGVRNGDTAAVSRGGAAGFTATFEIAAADEAGDGRVKRRPIRAGTTIAPYHPSAPLLPSPSPSAQQERREPGTMLNHRVGQLTTQRLSKSA